MKVNTIPEKPSSSADLKKKGPSKKASRPNGKKPMKGSKTKGKRKTKKVELLNYFSTRLPEAYPWKVVSHLAKDLEGYLTEEEASRLAGVLRNRDFDGYLAISEEWGLQSIVPTDTSTPHVAAKYLLASAIKKFQFPTDKDIRVTRATETFLAAEEACKSYNNLLYKNLTEYGTEWGVSVYHHARQFLVKLLGPELPGHRGLLNSARHGPGAVVGTEDGKVSLYDKYEAWPYSCTIEAHRYARFAIETDQRWFGALQDSYREASGIPKHFPLDMKRFWASVIYVVDGNRITFVPKNALTERTIAIEPALNLYLQLGVDGFIRKRLKRFGVDLDDQKKNQELARLGSADDSSKSFVTIDLSAASDSISLKLCELLLPKDWYSYLTALRSPVGELENVGQVVYDKISSMGNGYTFALESAIFAAFVYAVMKADGEPFDHKTFAVYGDDIIVERRWYFKVIEALRMAGFKANLDKTFVYGPVRESCGADWLHGKPIRPVFLEDIPQDVCEVLCDYNRIKRLLSLRWGIEEEVSSTLSWLWSRIPHPDKVPVGPYSNEEFDTYRHVPSPPKGTYKAWQYKYTRLQKRAGIRKGKNFLFRKLMHNLREQPPPQPWEKVLGAGGRFKVTSRFSRTLSYKSSLSSVWKGEYTKGGVD